MAVYGYVRVSTLIQSEEGESLGVQERTIQGYAMMHGLQMDRVFIERGVSGSKPMAERPQGAALLAAIKPGDVVIVAKLDRMFRSATDALAILDKLRAMGVSLHMIDLGGDVTGNGIAKLVFTILSAVAEAERDRIRERVRDVKADQKKRGVHLGGNRPFGYQIADDGTLIPAEQEQAAIRRMVELHQAGKSLRAIAGAVQDEFGVSLPHVSVKRVLRDAG